MCLTWLRAAPKVGGAEFVVAIAGKLERSTFTPEELAEIELATAALGDRCWYRPDPIPTDAAFSGLITVASVVYIAYEDWVFSSGLQSIAGHFNVPTIVANTGVMAERATTFQVGLAIDPTSPQEAAEAIRELLSEKPKPDGFARFNKEHETEAFKASLCSFVADLDLR